MSEHQENTLEPSNLQTPAGGRQTLSQLNGRIL